MEKALFGIGAPSPIVPKAKVSWLHSSEASTYTEIRIKILYSKSILLRVTSNLVQNLSVMDVHCSPIKRGM